MHYNVPGFFMNSNVRIVNAQNISLTSHNTLLRSGDVVNARVISHQGSSSYVLSVGGQKINVQSQIPLKEGAVFKAQIFTDKNTVQLKILEPAQNTNEVFTFSNSNFNAEDAGISKMLLNLGLPVCAESFKLVQFALSLGIKIQPSKLAKIIKKTNAQDSKTLEKAKISILLEEKGVNATENAVEKIFSEFYKKNEQKNEDKTDFQQQKNLKKSEMLKKDDIQDYFKQVEEASLNRNPGELTLFNSILPAKKGGAHWIVLPFEWNYKKFAGVIRVLFSENGKNLQKMLINCKNSLNSYLFVLYLKDNKVTSVKIGVKNTFDFKTVDFIKNVLKNTFSDCMVELVQFSETDCFDTESFALKTFEGEA